MERLSLFDVAESLFDEYGIEGDIEPEENGDQDVTGYLQRGEIVRNLCRDVKKRQKLVAEPLLTEILRTMKREKKANADISEREMFRKVQNAVARYLKKRANETIAAFYPDGAKDPVEPEQMSEDGRKAYEELLMLMDGIYESAETFRPDTARYHYSGTLNTAGSSARPLILREDHEPKRETTVFYPELKSRYRGHTFTNHYHMVDGLSVADAVMIGVIKRACAANGQAGKRVMDAVLREYVEWLSQAAGKRVFSDEAGATRLAVKIAREHGIDCVVGDDYPSSSSMYPGRFQAFDTTVLVLLYGYEESWIKKTFCNWRRGLTLLAAFNILYEIYETDELYEKYDRETASSYAEVYQDKKNIPLATVKAMAESPFNGYFGYVEYDRMVKADDAREVYRDFDAVIRTYFHEMEVRNCEIRFRYLGRHRASGLYYPALRCLCVDLRSPDSLMHEFFHLYDHEHGMLSESAEFRPVRKRYERLLGEWKRRNPEAAAGLKGKYDLSYYLTPTEIFARCGEMYLSRDMGVRNSVVPAGLSGFAYPEDEELSRLIRGYFGVELSRGRLLPAVVPENGFAAAASAAG